ncbi:MmpS family transport accessory protein [Mycobacteroides abscessus]|nr:MmpS family transport accessory protein [Mycobacteroides abscessus]MDM2223864.1 MmpS family transport accessory protein [Mycobacteroides abscessus]MDM2243367.1 MmpS family transport accessory protein [Mycobacteroides abscessus]
MTDPAWQQYPQEQWPVDEPIPYPEDPKPPKWPWIVAGISVLAVLAIALTSILVITRRTEVAAPTTVTVTPSTTWTGPNDVPLPSITTTEPPPPSPPPPNPSTGVETPTTTEAPPVPTTTEAPQPVPTTGQGPGGSGHGSKSVTYSVGGSGSQVNVAYMTDTEYVRVANISQPWAVTVTRTQRDKPLIMNVTIVGEGTISCSITVDGVTVTESTDVFAVVCQAPMPG